MKLNLARIVIRSLTRSIVNSANIDDNVALVEICLIAGANNLCVLVLGHQLDEVAGERFIAMEHTIVGANFDQSGLLRRRGHVS